MHVMDVGFLAWLSGFCIGWAVRSLITAQKSEDR